MADNITLNPGEGGPVTATDEVAGVHFQRVKLDLGAAGESSPVEGPLPITAAALEALLTTIAATIANHNAPFVDGSPGQIMLGKLRDADTTSVADGGLNTLNLDEEGRLKVASKAAKKKARAIEEKAARIVIERPADAESQFMELMRQWAAFKPVAVGPQDTTLEQLFAAEIAFRVRAIQQQLEDEQDEEEAILALLLA